MKSKKTVYLESSVVSYYANPIRDDIKVAAEQKITREWWNNVLPKMEGYISNYVIREVQKGDKENLKLRVAALHGLTVLPFNEKVIKLAEVYIKKLSLPKNSDVDAFHLAMATVYGVDFLVSWNCKHIANAFKYPTIVKVNKELGYESSTICTPRELMEV